jgi:hypothetical protein
MSRQFPISAHPLECELAMADGLAPPNLAGMGNLVAQLRCAARVRATRPHPYSGQPNEIPVVRRGKFATSIAYGLVIFTIHLILMVSG